MVFRAITLAGSDSGGGAGIQADLKTFTAFGVHGSSVVTAVTAQNTRELGGIWKPGPESVLRQFQLVMSDIGADAGKTGMLADAATVEAIGRGLDEWPIEKLVVDPVMVSKSGAHLLEAIGRGLDEWPIEKLVVDPVMVSKSGAHLLEAEAIEQFRSSILPKAYLLTPNLPEVEVLTGGSVRDETDLREAARTLVSMGARRVLIKGGHGSDPERSDDLFFDGREFEVFAAERIHSRNTHGTGCTLSAAIAALLARGAELSESIARAKQYVSRAIETAPGLGEGDGPMNHMWGIEGPPV